MSVSSCDGRPGSGSLTSFPVPVHPGAVPTPPPLRDGPVAGAITSLQRPTAAACSLRVCNSLSLCIASSPLAASAVKTNEAPAFPITCASGFLQVRFVDNGHERVLTRSSRAPKAPRDGDRMGQYEEIAQSPPPHRPGRPTIFFEGRKLQGLHPHPQVSEWRTNCSGSRGATARAKGLPMEVSLAFVSSLP